VVTDISSVRESLSGEHVKGYTAPERPAPPPPAPVAPPPPRPEAPRAVTPPPAPPPPRPRDIPPPAPREAAPPLRREAPPPRPPSDNRSGNREQYVALKPDPANDPAPRRLRTEASKPVPVQEYAPSSFARASDKSASAKPGREPGRRESSRSPAEPPRAVKPNATIPLHPKPSKDDTRSKKSGGIVGFIKRIFKAAKPVEEDEEEFSSERRDAGRDRDDEERGRDDSREHRHRHRHSGHHRHSRDRQDRQRGGSQPRASREGTPDRSRDDSRYDGTRRS
jgi:hypothetical protein